MKKILCFGDSNTFGFCPQNGSRYDEKTRWAGILSGLLKDFEIVEDGLNNRTCFANNPQGEEFTGINAIKKYKNAGFDYAFLFIGINDLQKQYNLSTETYKTGLYDFIKAAYNVAKDIILVCPTHLKKEVLNGYFGLLFDENSIEKSYMLPKIFEQAACELNVKFINANEISDVSNIDGLHYSKEGHRALALAFYKYFSNLIF